MSNTIADRIMDRIGNDGLASETPRGVLVADLMERCAWRRVFDYDNVRYVFRDDSEIVESGGAYDIGIGGCSCWVGCQSDYPETGGHQPSCELAPELED